MALQSAISGRAGIVAQDHRDYCGKDGHTENKCFINTANPSNKLTTKVKEPYAAVAAKSSTNMKDAARGFEKKRKVELPGLVGASGLEQVQRVENISITPCRSD